LEELQEWLIARDRRVITIRGQVQIGLLPEPAVITYDQITEEAARHDHPSLTIYLGGEEFEEYARQSLEARQKSAWVQSFFRGICHSLHPLLAVITMENWLPCLWEIRHQTSLGALPFTNFFVSHDILTDPLQQALASEFSQGYIADWDIGVYFSSTEEFNPAQKGFRDPWLRGRVAEILRGL
jgi:hypothetical protein